MLHRDKIVLVFGCLLCCIIFFSCKKKYDNKQQTLFRQNSLKVASTRTYLKVYNQANDTVNSWINRNLEVAKAYKVSNWKIDSLLCFNNSANKCVMCIYRQYNDKVNNAIDFLYGIRINYKWYFFEGAVVYVFSEKYGYAPNTPLPFSKLHEIAMKEIFRGYLKQNQQGKWEINEEFFTSLNNYDAYNYPYTTQEAWEESWLKLARENWEKREK